MSQLDDDAIERNRHATGLLKSLVGTDCRCGSAKEAHLSFCRSCYSSLPAPLQKALYSKFGKGYEAAYEKAAAYLGAHGH